jgi:hypothetical protein
MPKDSPKAPEVPFVGLTQGLVLTTIRRSKRKLLHATR